MSSGADRHTLAEHNALKKDEAWDALPWRKEWVFEHIVLEQRDCSCGTTLARESKRTMFIFKRPTTIATAIHQIRLLKDFELTHRFMPMVADAVRHARRTYEGALLKLCQRRDR